MGDDATQTVRGGVIPVFGGSLGDVGENKGLCGELLHYWGGGPVLSERLHRATSRNKQRRTLLPE